ncbi:MAG: dihydroneopterin aldolase [Actinobacteria bacterium]|nr:dihydroneopterin aldolase [Actinomycetota bacterium]
MRIEIAGITLHGLHGVLDEERREGQPFVFAVSLELAEPAEDDIEATVDYRDVVACVREVSDGQAYRLLETLAAVVADELMRRFRLAGVKVRVGKPELDLGGGRATVVVER